MEQATKKPAPRTGSYYGMRIHSLTLPDGSWLEGEEFCYPYGGMTRRVYAKFPDGQFRVAWCGIPDTYFSIPARARVRGKRVRGFITSDETGFKFNEYIR